MTIHSYYHHLCVAGNVELLQPWQLLFFFFVSTVVQNPRKSGFHASGVFWENNVLVGKNTNPLSNWIAFWIFLCQLMFFLHNKNLFRMKNQDLLKKFLIFVCISSAKARVYSISVYLMVATMTVCLSCF